MRVVNATNQMEKKPPMSNAPMDEAKIPWRSVTSEGGRIIVGMLRTAWGSIVGTVSNLSLLYVLYNGLLCLVILVFCLIDLGLTCRSARKAMVEHISDLPKDRRERNDDECLRYQTAGYNQQRHHYVGKSIRGSLP